jgi:cell division protein FtsL
VTQQEENRASREARKEDEQPKGFLRRLAAALTSLSAIATAIATIATSGVAILGVIVHNKSTELSHARTVTSSQAQQIHHQSQRISALNQQVASAQAAASAASASASAPSPSAAPSAAPSAQFGNIATYLSDQNPIADNAELGTGEQVIKTVPYPHSISFDCSSGGTPGEAFNVAGSSTLSGEIGIPDDSPNATGVIATVIFTDEANRQVGKPVQVSLGHPVRISMPIQGVIQLGMTCTGRDQGTNEQANGFQVAIGDAGVS